MKTDYETIFDAILHFARKTNYSSTQAFIPFSKIRLRHKDEINATCELIARTFISNGDGERALFAGWTREEAGVGFIFSAIGLYVVGCRKQITVASFEKSLHDQNAGLTLPEGVVLNG